MHSITYREAMISACVNTQSGFHFNTAHSYLLRVLVGFLGASVCIMCTILLLLQNTAVQAAELNLSDQPLFVEGSKNALLQLVVQRDNKLFFEAYPTYEDINNDGELDITYKPHQIDYYGYFGSYLCYQSFGDHFEAVSNTTDKKCSGSWSGDFLNYLTMTRMDVLLTALYGGKRIVDTANETRLRRAFVPWENHTWGIEYSSEAENGYKISDYSPLAEPTTDHRHLLSTSNVMQDAVPYLRIRLNVTERIWDWVDKEQTQGDGWACKQYPNGNHKPIGLLHEFGENNSLYFSLLTGSYENNLQGGVLRQTMGSFGDKEVNLTDGTFTQADGIVTNLDALQIPNDFEYLAVHNDCGFLGEREFDNGECRAWGNPVAEMMYEGLRYFSGIQQPTPEFYTDGGVDESLGLAPATWDDPYSSTQPYGQCSTAHQLVISDPSPSFDSDQLPGSAFGNFSSTSLGDLHVGDIADFISSNESTLPGLKFIGETSENQDKSPTPKLVTSFRDIRGQAPDAPHQKGSYLSPSVSYYGHTNDLHPTAPGKQSVRNFTIALGSPYPSIEVDVNGSKLNFLPFARSVVCGDTVPVNGLQNAIVGVNVEYITDTEGSFRVSFEDHPQGADNDLDAIARYRYKIIGNQVEMITESVSAVGCWIQHMGYVVSGSTQDGTYLVVRDLDTAADQDVDFIFDVPPGQTPGGNWNDGAPLPLTSTNYFTPSDTPAAQVLPSPLWYAAKWGGFDDINGDGIPQTDEWDADGDGEPDNYFSVSNPAKMQATMRSVFQKVIETTASATSVTASSGSLRTGQNIYRAEFHTDGWTGDVRSYSIDLDGTVSPTPDWSARDMLNQKVATGTREILSYNPVSKLGVPFRWPVSASSPTNNELSIQQLDYLSQNPVTNVVDSRGEERLEYIRGESKDGFRVREDYLGDIVHSNPTLVAAPGNYYPDDWGLGAAENSKPYSEFIQTNRNRQRVVYVGANDGMLHAFDAGSRIDSNYSAGSGEELFAYIPAAVYNNLPELASSSYSHKYFVDATPRVADVFINNDWRTVLIGGLRSGGQGIYALDITEPDQIKESVADQFVLWEFTDMQEKDVGFNFSSPVIARMANGKWAAIIANGYNNSAPQVGYQQGDGWSSILIVDIESGQLIRKLHPATDRCRGNSVNLNGPAEPTAIDIDYDNIIDTIYAGDLNGCVYAFDVSPSNPATWSAGELKHEAVDDSGNPAPITVPISVGSHPTGQGVMLYFGTGKYLEPSDLTASQTSHRFYAIWDKGPGTDTANRTTVMVIQISRCRCGSHPNTR